MALTRALQLVVLCTAQIGHAALAGTFVAQTTPDTLQLLEPVARKGTRAYSADDPTATAPATAAPTTPAAAPTTTDALDQCMATWDTGTHISKNKWRDICKRQLEAGDADQP